MNTPAPHIDPAVNPMDISGPGLWPELTKHQVMGKYLASRREQLELTQKDVAARLRVSADSVASWELGRRWPRPEMVGDIFVAYELPYWIQRVIEDLVFARRDGLRTGTWPPQLTDADYDHLESFTMGPAYLHGMPQYDLVAANSKAVQMIPGLVPAPCTAPEPVNVITFFLQALTDDDRVVGNLEEVLQRMIWLLKTMGVGIVQEARMRQIRRQCRAINREAFEDMWRSELSEAVVNDTTVWLLHPATSRYMQYSYRCKEDVHPYGPYQTYHLAPKGVGAALAAAHRGTGSWSAATEPTPLSKPLPVIRDRTEGSLAWSPAPDPRARR